MPTCFSFAFMKRRTRRVGVLLWQEEDPEAQEQEESGIADDGDLKVSSSSPAVSLPILSPSSPRSAGSSSTAALSSQLEPCLSSPALLSPSPDTLVSSPDPVRSLLHEAYVQLPLELWAEIFGFVDQCTLQDLMLVNQMLGQEAERLLYRHVFLGSSRSLAIFFHSITASPNRAALVTRIHIPSIEDYDSYASLEDIPALLRLLDKLQHLSLNLFETRLPRDYMFVLQMILSIRFPLLRSLSLRMPLFLDDSFLGFLQSHPHLSYLDLGEIPPSVQTDYSSYRFPAISSLACTFRLLTSLRPVLPSLTHLHVLSCSSAHLLRVAELFGSRIVSLRLGSIYVPIQRVHHERPALSLGDVAARFPRLRFLQIDMGQEDNRYSRVQAVNHRLKRRQLGDSVSHESDRKRITLVWAFARPKHGAHGVWLVPGYQRFLNKVVLEVLKEWGHYVERVVCTHGGGAYESLVLDEESSRLVWVEERAGWDGWWRSA